MKNIFSQFDPNCESSQGWAVLPTAVNWISDISRHDLLQFARSLDDRRDDISPGWFLKGFKLRLDIDEKIRIPCFEYAAKIGDLFRLYLADYQKITLAPRHMVIRYGQFEGTRNYHLDPDYLITTTVLTGPGTVIGRQGDTGPPKSPLFQVGVGDVLIHTGEERERWYRQQGVSAPAIRATNHAAPVFETEERALLVIAFGLVQ